MANLNFQQPPRIASSSMSRNTSTGFTSSNSISGNVTPTSSLMFQTQQNAANNSNFVVQQQQQQPSQQQQLSPNRSGGQLNLASGSVVGPMNSRRMYQQNPTMQRGNGFGSTSLGMGTFVQSQTSARFGSQGGSSGISSFQSVFGVSDTPPTLLDMSEFPSLTNARGMQNDHSNVLQAPGSKPYGKK